MSMVLVNKDISPSVAAVHEATIFHGVNGFWSDDCGLDREVFSAYVQPFGILQYLPAYPTEYDLIRIGAITGFQSDTEDEPDGYCDLGPTGLYSTCRLDFNLGRIKRTAKTQAYTDTIMRRDRGDQDFILRGRLGNSETSLGGLNSGIFNGTSPQALNFPSELQRKAIAQNLALTLGEMIWEGDPTAPAPANTPGGGKKSFLGFDGLIRVGYEDAGGEGECPTMDSQVYDFNFGDVCSGEVDINGRTFNLISLLQAAAMRNEMLARDSYLMPLVGVIVMAEGLWQQLTDCYACLYNLNNCSANIVLNDGFTIRERDAMREGMYIRLNGKLYVVVTDNGIPVLDDSDDPDNLDAGERASDIYFIPLSVMGMNVTYMRYLDFRLGAANLNVTSAWGDPRGMFTWTDDGKYLLTRQWVEECWLFSATIMPGLVMRTPQFAWRINNVKWTDAIPFRNPYPDSPDFVIDSPLI